MTPIRITSEQRIPIAFWLVLWLAIVLVALLFVADPAARIPPIYDPWAPWSEPTTGAR
jgi:hypothetical protein